MLGRLLNGLVDIIYPKVCLACKNRLKDTSSVDNLICGQCWSKIKKNPPPFCYCCGRHLETPNQLTNICLQCVKKKLHFDRAFSPCIYEGVIKELIHEFKYKGKDYLGATLSRLMVEFIKEYNFPMESVDFIIPVPLHKARLREREFNQAQILSKYIAAAFDKKTLDSVLRRHCNTKAQVDLNEENERMLNVKGSFTLDKKSAIIGKNILLVDDVLTTGATCSEAALALKNSGSGTVFVLTLAN